MKEISKRCDIFEQIKIVYEKRGNTYLILHMTH